MFFKHSSFSVCGHNHSVSLVNVLIISIICDVYPVGGSF